MKKIIFIITIFLCPMIGCKEEQKTSSIIIKFEDDIFLPNNFSPININEYKILQNQYQKLNNKNFKTLDNSFSNEFFNGLNKIFNEKITLYPLFENVEIGKYYTRIANAGTGNNCPAMLTSDISKIASLRTNLQNYFSLSICVRAADCNQYISKLNTFFTALGLKITVSCASGVFQYSDNEKQQTSVPAKESSTFFDFRSLMRINELNLNLGLNGANSQITILENSRTVNTIHNEFTGRRRLSSENLGFGADNSHATRTFGLLFSNTNTISASTWKERLSNDCKGIAYSATPHVIYFSFNPCGFKSNGYGAMLRAINRTDKGGILLIEFALTPYPVETDAIYKSFVQSAVNVLGITVIEPIGNGSSNLDINLDSLTSFDAILVGAASKSGENFVHTPGVHTSQKYTTCLGIGNDLLTTDVTASNYTSFGSSSGASAIIAGLASCMQGYYYDNKGCYLTPQQMKCLFRCTPSRYNVRGIPIPDAMNLKEEIDLLIKGTPRIPCLLR